MRGASNGSGARPGATAIVVVPALLVALGMVLPFAAASQVDVSVQDLSHLSSNLMFNGGPAWGYRPVMATVAPGGTITFTNTGALPHTVTSFTSRFPVPISPDLVLQFPVPDGVFDSSPSFPPSFADVIMPGGTFTLSTAGLAQGTYTYFCKLHQWMVAAVNISPDGAVEVSASITDGETMATRYPFAGSATWGYLPRVTEVKQGTLVVFTNSGFFEHTVTSGPIGPGAGSKFDSGVFFPGQAYSLDTSTISPGEHPYFCAVHPWMQGALRVNA